MRPVTPIAVRLATGLLYVAAIAGCHPHSHYDFSSKPGPVGHNFRLLVWNEGPRTAGLDVYVDDQLVIQEEFKPTDMRPAIVAMRYATLPVGQHTIVAIDHSLGKSARVKAELSSHVNVHVQIRAHGITVDANENAHEMYL